MSEDLRFPPLSEVMKFKNQDFDNIRSRCLSESVLWEDPWFPPDRILEWKRPWEITEHPCFIEEDEINRDIRQGLLNDCYLVAAIQALTTRSELLYWVVPKGQICTKDNGGVAHFRLWQFGTWYDICVDDRLPTKEGRLVYTHSKNKQEFWCALLEKACAKVHGSFKMLEVGRSTDAMVDFSGGIPEKINLNSPPNELGNILVSAFENKLLMCCTIRNNTKTEGSRKFSSTFQMGDYEYTITRVQYVPTLSQNALLIRLRNPCAFHKPLDENSSEWSSIPDEMKAEFVLDVNTEGEFWISETDFIEHFSTLSICHFRPDTFKNSNKRISESQNWKMKSLKGKWVVGVSAGGISHKTMHQNPQYIMKLSSPDDGDMDGSCSVVISLMQKNKARHKEWQIGYKLFQLHKDFTPYTPLGSEVFASNLNSWSFGFQRNRREVVNCQKLLPGVYCIIPCTQNMNEEGEFILRVFTKKAVLIEEIDDRLGLKNVDDIITELSVTRDIPLAIESKTDEDVVKLFCEIAGEVMTVDWEGLKVILDHLGCDMHDYSPITGILSYTLNTIRGFINTIFPFSATPQDNVTDKVEFSKDMCRRFISFMGNKDSGRIGLDEFDKLWSQICMWKLIYGMYIKRKKEYMDAADLRSALGKAGFGLNNRINGILIHKFADEKGHLSFDDFIMCVITLQLETASFKNIDKKNTGKVAVTLDQWIELTLFS